LSTVLLPAAYHSFAEEVEALNTPTIRRLTLSCRHQLSPIAPVYLVLDCQADLKTVVGDLLSGQYRRPLRIVTFNTGDGCIQDVSAEVARELLSCEDELELPLAVRDFVGRQGR
jgi:hypothetical protein